MYYMFQEEYFTHELNIPGGGDELITFIQVLSLITAFTGCNFWKELIWEQKILWIRYTMFISMIVLSAFMFGMNIVGMGIYKSI
jgi:hypothetical protein